MISSTPFTTVKRKYCKNASLHIKFDQTKINILDTRKYDIMKCIWEFIEKGNGLLRKSIFNECITQKKEIHMYEMNEFRKYINVEIVEEVMEDEKKEEEEKKEECVV